MNCREIVTLQIGHYANFTGSHWWNLQEASFIYNPHIVHTFPSEVKHDVLFREGCTFKGEVTYTPRLVTLDLKGSLNTLRKEGSLYSENKDEDGVKWSGDVTLHKSSAVPKNQFLQDLDDADDTEKTNGNKGDQRNAKEDEDDKQTSQVEAIAEEPVPVFGRKFYNLDGQVKVWSDFLRIHFHPRSIQILDDCAIDSEDQPFDVFGLGKQALSGQAWEQFEDRVRFFSEECDLMQGFHLMFDSHNSFGGCAAKALAYLKDEFCGKSILSLPLTPAIVPDVTAQQRATRILNKALCVGECSEDSSLYVPLSLASSLWRNLGAPRNFPHLSYNPELPYHTSAILAASLDTMTMPYRKESASVQLSELTSALSLLGRKISALNTSLPFPILEEESFADTLMSEREEKLWQPLTPHADCQSHVVAQSCVVRGIPVNKVKRSGGSSPWQLSSCNSIDDILQLYLSKTYSQAFNAGCVMRDPLKVVAPFPHIFLQSVNPVGLLSATQRPPKCGVESVPIMTSLQSNASMGDFVSSLHAEASRFHIKRHHHFLEAGLEEEDFTQTLANLQSLADCYSLVAEGL